MRKTLKALLISFLLLTQISYSKTDTQTERITNGPFGSIGICEVITITTPNFVHKVLNCTGRDGRVTTTILEAIKEKQTMIELYTNDNDLFPPSSPRNLTLSDLTPIPNVSKESAEIWLRMACKLMLQNPYTTFTDEDIMVLVVQ